MSNILFIIPPHISFDDFLTPRRNSKQLIKKDGKAYGSLVTDMPLGALTLSGYLKKYSTTGVQTKLLDFNIELNEIDSFTWESSGDYYLDSLRNELDFEPDVVALSALFTSSFRNFVEIADCCRRMFPDAMLLAGGSVPTNMYEHIFEATDAFDALCYGEGEKPFLELIDAEDRQDALTRNPCWITKNKVEEKFFFAHDFIEDLDEIPICDYEICKMEKYGANPAIMAYGSIKDKVDNFHVMTSRGCPFRCTFCASHKVHGRDMRYYSLERVKSDLLYLKENFGAKILVFQDDHFMGDTVRAKAIANYVAKLGLRGVFQNGLTLYALDREMLKTLKNAGADQLVLPVESGSARVLKELMRKPLKLAIAERVADDCLDLGIYTNANILIGMPGETKQDIEDSRAFLKKLNVNWCIILIATPLVGSEMYDTCVEEDYIDPKTVDCDFRKSVIETDYISAEYVQNISYDINLDVNFVENSDFARGDYELALKGFETAIKAKNDHAFAYYYAAKCYEELGRHAQSDEYHDKAMKIRSESPFWQGYFDRFEIQADEDSNLSQRVTA